MESARSSPVLSSSSTVLALWSGTDSYLKQLPPTYYQAMAHDNLEHLLVHDETDSHAEEMIETSTKDSFFVWLL